MKVIIFFLFFFLPLHAAYLDNHTCKECHESIYEEFQSSKHANSYFDDELHQKIADTVSTTKYGCALCHYAYGRTILMTY